MTSVEEEYWENLLKTAEHAKKLEAEHSVNTWIDSSFPQIRVKDAVWFIYTTDNQLDLSNNDCSGVVKSINYDEDGHQISFTVETYDNMQVEVLYEDGTYPTGHYTRIRRLE